MTAPRIESYRFREVVIDGRRYSNDLIICPDGVDDQWWREQGHALAPADIWEVLPAAPEILVIGQGAAGRMRVLAETERVLRHAGIELVIERTPLACYMYNRLSESRRVVAALHLTC